MRLAFDATEFGFESDKHALVCGLSGCDAAGQAHYLTLSRDAEGNFEDWGVHLEYDDQSNGAYECISRCELQREALRVDLTGTLREKKQISGFDVALRIDDALFDRLRVALRQIVRGESALLVEIS
jgi:hypothetical protein